MSSATTITIKYLTPNYDDIQGPGVESSTSMKLRTKPRNNANGIDYEKMAEDFLFEINMMGVEKITSLLKAMKIEEHGQWVREKLPDD